MKQTFNVALKPLVAALAVIVASGCANITGTAEDHFPGTAKVGDGVKGITNAKIREWDAAPKAEAAPAPTPVAAAPAEPPKAEAAPTPPANEPKTVKVADAPPPAAKPGQCYTKLLLPAEYRTEAVQTVVKPASETVTFSEPVYEDVEEKVVVQPAFTRKEIVPAEYAEVQEKIVVREAYRREIEIPALYNTYFEQVMEKPARQIWKPGRGVVERVDEVTGEILCLVEEPASYKTVERKELARPASKRYEDVPAEYANVTKTVVKTPESVREVQVPAEYSTVKVRKLVKAAEAIKTPVPAEVGTVDKKVMVQAERTEWVQVLCEQNVTADKITQIKSALKTKGLDAGSEPTIDGQLTTAVKSFQEKEGLRGTGLMTADTLQALGVDMQ